MKVGSMRMRSVALASLVFLAGCASGSSATGGKAPTPASAATQSLSDADKSFTADKFNHAMESALSGQTSSWTTPSGDYQVQVTPTRMFQKADNTYCREFTQSIQEGHEAPSSSHGTACRQSDGTWQIVG
jgi:surface antigen